MIALYSLILVYSVQQAVFHLYSNYRARINIRAVKPASNEVVEMAPSSLPLSRAECACAATALSPRLAPCVSSGEVWLLKLLFQSSLKEAEATSASASRAVCRIKVANRSGLNTGGKRGKKVWPLFL